MPNFPIFHLLSLKNIVTCEGNKNSLLMKELDVPSSSAQYPVTVHHG